MVRVLWLVAATSLSACGARLDGGPDLRASDAAPPDIQEVEPDVAPDVPAPLGPWSTPTPVGITPATDDDPTLTGDQLELYFNRANDIFVTKRASVSDAWGTPEVVTQLSVAAITDTTPEITYDGLTIFLASARAPLTGALDIWKATRASRDVPFNAPVKVTELSTAAREAATASGNNLQIVFELDVGGTNELVLAERPNAGVPFGTPVAITAVNSPQNDGNPMLSANQLELYFNSNRSGNEELYVARRASTADAFGPPELISELADAVAADSDPWISQDGRTLYFTSNRDNGAVGALRLWQSTR